MKRASNGRLEGGYVIERFGWWVRFYMGSSYFPRPMIHRWEAYGSKGITLRGSSKTPGPGGHRVFGIQWRPSRDRVVYVRAD